MNIFRFALIALLAAGPSAAGPLDPPLGEAADPIALVARIRQLEQRVARLERLGSHDLVEPGMLAVRGVWRIDSGQIVSPDDPVALLQLPRDPPEEYILSMRVRRISGNNTFAIGIPVGGRQVLVALDAHACTVSGLEHLDGRFVHENDATKRGSLFVPDTEATVTVTVRKDRITCAFDDVKVVDWSGDAQRLSLSETFAVPDRKALFLATLASSYAVSEMILLPLTFPAAALDKADTPAAQITPTESAARLAGLKARWKLQFLPEQVPEIGSLLVGTAWEQRSIQDILGRGTDHFIRFPAPSEPGEERTIVLTTVRHLGANAHIPMTRTTLTFPLAITGAFLEYDGLIHTAFAIRGRKLIPDAVIRVGDRLWYQISSRKLMQPESGVEDVEVTEHLMEFEDDPMMMDKGTLTVHRNVRKLSDQTGNVTRISTNFVLQRQSGGNAEQRQIQIASHPTLYFFNGQDYALSETFHPQGTGIFLPEKK